MSVYLHDIPLPEAQARLQQALEHAGRAGLLGSEDLPLDERCVGRVLVEPVWAKISSPHYHASAMEACLCAAATANADLKPGDLECDPSAGSVRAAYLDTDPLLNGQT
jgi:putative molybdopterin biosynthesis protein